MKTFTPNRNEPQKIKNVHFYTPQERLEEAAYKKAKAFVSCNSDSKNGRIMSAAKRIIFDDMVVNDVNLTKKENLEIIVGSIRYIVEEVMELTPEQYDALYSVTFNQKGLLDHAIRKLVTWVPGNIRKETLFNNKSILFKMCWPEYYEKHFEKITPFKIFYAEGEVKSNLARAGRPKLISSEMEESKKIAENEEKNLNGNTETQPQDCEGAKQLQNGKFSSAKKSRKRNYTYGKEVDEIVFKAMWTMFSYMQMPTKELFKCLANPKKSSFNRIGCMKIIEKRECYPSPLDFFMWNAPLDYQYEHLDEYMEARNNAKLERIPILDMRYEAFLKAQERKNDIYR